jgi:hypothetical protein
VACVIKIARLKTKEELEAEGLSPIYENPLISRSGDNESQEEGKVGDSRQIHPMLMLVSRIWWNQKHNIHLW